MSRKKPGYVQFLVIYFFSVFLPTIVLGMLIFWGILLLIFNVFVKGPVELEGLVYIFFAGVGALFLAVTITNIICALFVLPRFYDERAEPIIGMIAHSIAIFFLVPLVYFRVNSMIYDFVDNRFSTESKRYIGSVTLSGFQEQLLPPSSYGSNFRVLRITAQVDAKQEGEYNFDGSVSWPFKCGCKSFLNGKAVEPGGWTILYLPRGNSTIVHDFVFDQVCSHSPEIDKNGWAFVYEYSINKPGKIISPDLFNLFAPEPKYEDWTYVVIPLGTWRTKEYSRTDLEP